MACTPQELINADPCHGCLTEQQGDWALTMLLCVVAGGVTPPPTNEIVIGEEGTDEGIIGGEDGNTMIGAE